MSESVRAKSLLLAVGLLDGAEDHLKLPEGYYGLDSLFWCAPSWPWRGSNRWRLCDIGHPVNGVDRLADYSTDDIPDTLRLVNRIGGSSTARCAKPTPRRHQHDQTYQCAFRPSADTGVLSGGEPTGIGCAVQFGQAATPTPVLDGQLPAHA